MTRQYVQALLRHRDREFAISHLWEVTGFRQQAVALIKLSLSPTSYTLKRRIEMAVRDVTTTSSRLLYLIFYTGLLIFGLSIAVILCFLGRYFTSGIGVDGFASIIVSIWFLGGLITFILGILGIYLANILAETKRRPYTIVRRIYRSETTAAPTSVDNAGPDARPMTRDHSLILSDAAAYYASRLAQHGATSQGVDWNGAEFASAAPRAVSQAVSGRQGGFRHRSRLRFWRLPALSARGRSLRPLCRLRHRTQHDRKSARTFRRRRRSSVARRCCSRGDGRFRGRKRHIQRQGGYSRQRLACLRQRHDRRAGPLGRRGFGFNVLSLSSDPARRKPHLHYADPTATLEHCLLRYGRSVALLQDYGLYEFTIIVRHASES